MMVSSSSSSVSSMTGTWIVTEDALALTLPDRGV